MVNFPALTLVNVGGWDGVVRCDLNCGNVPEGTSLWEFSTEKPPKGKANRDYKKRTEDPLGYDPSQCTFIIVTTEYWRDREKWVREKLAEGIWKDVRVYDSQILEEWFDDAQVASRLFASDLDKVPTDGTQTSHEFWERWSRKQGLALVPEVVTAGRQAEQKKLTEFLSRAGGLIGIQASTKIEATAFVVASAKSGDDRDGDGVSSRMLVISDPDKFRAIAANSRHSPLILIPTFSDLNGLQNAALTGHHVVVPFGADEPSTFETFSLPIVDRDGQIEALSQSGLSREDSARYSREAGRNVSILRSLLGFPTGRHEWATGTNVRDIIPAVLLGRWDREKPGDRSLLERLSGRPYEEYEKVLFDWRRIAGAPIIQIGEMWRLVSPLDAWLTVGLNVRPDDLERLKECVNVVLKAGNPILPGRYPYETPRRSFSEWAREGIVQSLTLIAIYGDKFRIALPDAGQKWVDEIVSSLFEGTDVQLWISLQNQLPSLAEASPLGFVESVFSSLNTTGTPIMEMFKEEPGFWAPRASHPRLLFALEACAWLPEMLEQSTICLAHLARLDPGGTLGNRPMNSLTNIYKTWHHQTFADKNGRIKGIDSVVEADKEIGWKFLMGLLIEDGRDAAYSTYKFRWRLLDKTTRHAEIPKEMADIERHIMGKIIAMFDGADAKAVELINGTLSLDDEQRAAIRKLLDSFQDTIKKSGNLSWNGLRRLLHNQRSTSNADERMSDNELMQYEELYKKFTPVGQISSELWLFEGDWISLPEGGEFADDFEGRVEARQLEGARNILAKFGMEAAIASIGRLKEPYRLADSLGKIAPNDDYTLRIAELFKGDNKQIEFARSYFFRRSFMLGTDWMVSTFRALRDAGFDDRALGQFLMAPPFSQELWSILNAAEGAIQREYWTKVPPMFHRANRDEKNWAINQLIQYQRPAEALTFGSRYTSELETSTIIAALEALKGGEEFPITESSIQQMFKELDGRQGVDRSALARLEFKYLGILAGYGSRRTPTLLHSELTADPEFFAEVLIAGFRPKNDERFETEPTYIDLKIRQHRADQATKLLYSWRNIPGVSDDKGLDRAVLREWVDRARTLAKTADRIDPADGLIGTLLAKYPEHPTYWPPDEIAEVIEQINSERMKEAFTTQAVNNHSFSTRGPFDGGKLERDLAAYFQKMAAAHKRKHPQVAKILSNVVDRFLRRAKEADQDAERDRLDY